ncbi:TPA: galactokinase [Candidatus Poribacteria bacterium]|nr:galactokinase [Candidatus Poribacteria bacterium]
MIEKEILIKGFKESFGFEPELISRAPGRVNLIGEHTDYNDGFVLPIALEMSIHIAASGRSDRKVVLRSLDLDQTVEFDLDRIERDEEHPWSNYPRGVAYVLQEEGYKLRGMNGVISGDVPQGAGLSSSAAFELSSAMAFLALSDLQIPLPTLARLCQRAENQFIGVNCGIMDQFISAAGRKGHALFLDCRSLDYQLIPLNLNGYKIAICNTMVKRELTSSEYNVRRSECEEGVKMMRRRYPNIKALRDLTSEMFERYADELPLLIRRRCGYVIRENERVLSSVEALKAGDLARFGKLMNLSHDGLKEEYEVSCFELDTMVELARSVDGVLGARMTGAGFGGCTVNLVSQNSLESFISRVKEGYKEKTGISPEIYISDPADGAEVTRL